MLWLLFAISSYFLYAIAALIDRHLLKSSIPSPNVYCFYVGILGILALFLIPLGFSIPHPFLILISLLAGAVSIFSLWRFYIALKQFDASVVLPAIGGIMPVVTFFAVYFIFQEREMIAIEKVAAFICLILGSILISMEEKKSITLKSLQHSFLIAILFSAALVLSKYIYSKEMFWSGFIWMRIGAAGTALLFLFSKEVREEIFRKKASFKKKTMGLFLSNQTLAAAAFILQNWAIALVPFIYLAVINALEGTKYLFLLIIVAVLSIKYKNILKGEISKENLIQKAVAVLLISVGLAILALK